MQSKFDDPIGTAQAVADGRHREMVGGMWDEIGALQFNFLVAHGVRPSSYLIDIGCGCLRGGVHFAAYLDSGHYFGLDRHEPLLAAGFDIELARAGIQHKVPRANLLCSETFEMGRFGRHFDFAIAQSLFTHMDMNNIRLCLANLSMSMRPGGRFFASFFERPEGLAESALHRGEGGSGITYAYRNLYHYGVADLEWLAGGFWRSVYLGAWNHPRDQKMMLFERL